MSTADIDWDLVLRATSAHSKARAAEARKEALHQQARDGLRALDYYADNLDATRSPDGLRNMPESLYRATAARLLFADLCALLTTSGQDPAEVLADQLAAISTNTQT
ncbi:hypothetical protein [Streptosporangium sp. NPDC002524]|uniref:hypothetical protein n=1 Tax=Streptosporangium sp. NPDC002524 TaxID=3154537 RepID=UPI0033330E75